MHTRLIGLVVAALVVLAGPAAGDESVWATIQERASEQFGEAGGRAAAFLATHRPQRDAQIDPDLVIENIGLALHARTTYPWAADVSEDLFFNDILPYAVLDETRERWRPRLHELASAMVVEAKTATEAAQALNRELFKSVNVTYSTGRRKANQSPLESMELGLASCTGLSILLVDACRSVGIPARVAGIASWTDRNGNHTWVEIHDGERWRFAGAAEYDASGLDRGWFAGPASHAIEGHELHAIWASSWRRTGDRFPLAWNMSDRSVPGVDVSSRYTRTKAAAGTDRSVLTIRLWASRGGTRLAAEVTALEAEEVIRSRTFADPDDINRVAELADTGQRPLRVALHHDGQRRTAVLSESHAPGRVIELYWDELALSREAAVATAASVWDQHAASVRAQRQAELEAMSLRCGDYDMRLMRRDFGSAPASGASLWISMHGGGGAPSSVNDQQWSNQVNLYTLPEGICIAPRAPTDTWNLWHRPEIDCLLDRLIESAIIAWGVDPDRVYLIGYSAGGDGVYQLAPRLADRFAAASMMAGHPNDSSPLGLRNLPFGLFMGAEDAAYNRNTVAQQWADQLAQLLAADPDGYEHMARIYPDLGHWMNRKDAEAIPWMAQKVRDPWPRSIVWRQGNTTHERFYWLAVPDEEAVRGRVIRASVEGQTITIESDAVSRVELLLSDALLDLDEAVTVMMNGRTVHAGHVERTESAIGRSLSLRPDPRMIATAVLKVGLDED